MRGRAFTEVSVVLLVLSMTFTARQFANGQVTEKPEAETPKPLPCEAELSIPLRSPKLLRNGSLWDPRRKEMYPPGTYWKFDSSTPKEQDEYVGCPCKLGRPCLRKCCPLGKQFDEVFGCVPNPREDEDFLVSVSSDDGSQHYSVLAPEHFYLLFGNTCYYGYYRLMPETYKDNGYFLRSSNGSLAMPVAHVDSLWTDEFCVDQVAGLGELRPFLCLPLFKRMKLAIPSIEYPVFLLISTLIACCTFLSYILLKETRQTLDAKLRILLLFNVFYAFLLHACVMIFAGDVKEFQTLTLGIGSQFFTLAAGCWISVMLFCISLSSWASVENIDETMAKKLIYYCVYSWGIPLLALLLAAVTLKSGELPYNEVNPGYAEARAWVEIFQGALLYFFGADAFLLVFNVILASVNVIKIHQFNKEISVLGDNAVFSKHKEALQSHKKRFSVCFILLVIYCTFRMVEAAYWMVDIPEPGLYVVDIVDFLAEIAICAVLIINDGIFTILKGKLLSVFPSLSVISSRS